MQGTKCRVLDVKYLYVVHSLLRFAKIIANKVSFLQLAVVTGPHTFASRASCGSKDPCALIRVGRLLMTEVLLAWIFGSNVKSSA